MIPRPIPIQISSGGGGNNAIVPADGRFGTPQAFVDAAVPALAPVPVTSGAFVMPNATIPGDAAVLPPAAFIELLPRLATQAQTAPNFTTATAVTFMAPSLVAAVVNIALDQAFDFSGCALAGVNIATIADALVTAGFAGGDTVDFSGSNSALDETPVTPELWTMVTWQATMTITNAGGAISVIFSGAVDLGDSSVSGSTVTIGYQDSPTEEQKRDQFILLWPAVIGSNSFLNGVTVTPDTDAAGGFFARLNDGDATHFPYSFTGAITEDQVGGAAVKNSHIVALAGAGVTGHYNGTVFGSHTAF